MWRPASHLQFATYALSCVLLMGLATPALASTRITGVVTDAATGEPLPGAAVVIDGTSIGSATNEEGRYTIPAAPSGTRTIVASYLGYRTERREVALPDGQSIELEFALVWEGVTGDEVVVTAQASGQMAAINQQLQSNTISNIVSADRIQELPDVNAAESIGRLPGISIQRSGGEANRIAIRGLSPKYSTVTVNGVRVPATGADDRSIDLSLVSSNMLDGIEVRKAITADMDADAIAGSVDLRLRDAPEGLLVDVLAQGGHNQLQDYYGNYKFAGTVSNRFFDSKLGIIGTFNADRYDRSADVFNGNYDQTQNTTTGEQEILISSLNLREQNVERRRVGASVLADYRIPFGKIAANAFYNRLSNDALVRVNQLFNATNGRLFYNMEDTQSNTSMLTAALSAEQDLGWIRYDAGVSYTGSMSENPKDYLWTFTQEGEAYAVEIVNADGDTLNFVRTPGMNPAEVVPFITPKDSITAIADLFTRSTERNEDNVAIQLNASLPFRFGDHVTGYFKTGGKLRWLDRKNDEQQFGANGLQYGVGPTTQWLQCVDAQVPEGINGYDLYDQATELGRLPMWVFYDDYSRPDFFDGTYPLGFTAGPAASRKFTDALSQCEDMWLERVNDSRGRDYTGEEQYRAFYGMAEINIGSRITLIPGLRFEGDRSEYVGQQYREAVVNNRQAAPTDLDTLVSIRENDFWLPMLHLNVRPTNWLQVRLARTETLARPDYIQYVPITRINSTLTAAFAGNSQLKPSHSTNYDAALAIYQNHVGLFTFAAFHKTIEDHIRWVRIYTTNKDPLPEYLNVPEGWLPNNPYVDTYINNPDEATYRGFELDWQTNFWYLPSYLKGLVLNVNYTRILSETVYRSFKLERVCTNCVPGEPPPPRPISEFRSIDVEREGRMVDQPAHIANVTLGYDLKGFSARLSWLYQTDRVNNVNATTPVLDTFTGEYVRWDLALRQKLREGFEVFANLNNLTNTKDRSFQASAVNGSPTYIENYGFSIDLGARYRF